MLLNTTFWCKKDGFREYTFWHVRIDNTYKIMFGILHTDAIKESFFYDFKKDRKRWMHWLFEAKKRFGLRILNYTVISNHIHLLVIDRGREVKPKSIQLVAGRTAQEYNQRKNRKGAFWEDRYHATAIATDQHLIGCLIYIDLNMVRAGVVNHPSEWAMTGYNEIQDPPDRYGLIDLNGLMELCGLVNKAQLRNEYKQWVEDAINIDGDKRDSCWTESIAVGNRQFVEDTKDKLGLKSQGRRVVVSMTSLCSKSHLLLTMLI